MLVDTGNLETLGRIGSYGARRACTRVAGHSREARRELDKARTVVVEEGGGSAGHRRLGADRQTSGGARVRRRRRRWLPVRREEQSVDWSRQTDRVAAERKWGGIFGEGLV
jgi:hypothetical protein